MSTTRKIKPIDHPDPRALTKAGYSALPLPRSSKWPPPEGFTGRGAPMASLADVATWLDEDAYGNVAVRLPEGVVGIDVDAYAGKDGQATWEALGVVAGGFPATVRVTAREDGVSGIRLYRLPAGTDEADLWGSHGNVDLIRHSHRYLVGPGSTHPEGGVYRVVDEATGEVSLSLPKTKDLPCLTSEQAKVLTVTGAPWAGDPGAVERSGSACEHLTTRMARTLNLLSTGQGRHDTVTAEIMALVRLGERGHPGLGEVLPLLAGVYVGAIMRDPQGRGSISPREIRAEWDRMVDGAEAKVSEDPTPEEQRGCRSDVPLDEPDEDEVVPRLPLEFWAARGSLQHVRQAARSRGVGPDGVLLASLVRVATSLDPCWVLPPIVGTPASANLFGALVLGSGGGKSSSKDLAAEIVPLPSPLAALDADGEHASGRGTVREVTMGTGEGLVDAMGHKDGRDWLKGEHALMVDSDEVDSFMGTIALGTGTSAMLRTAWSGGAIGGTYRGRDSKARCARLDYRLGLLLGAQPERTGGLLSGKEAHGGTPQRILWASVLMDDDLTRKTRPDWPGALEWEPWVNSGQTVLMESTHEMVDTHGREVTRYGVRVAESVQDQVWDDHETQAKTMGGGLDAHRNLLRLKTALALGLLERAGAEPEITEEDWRLAGIMLETSVALREWIADKGSQAQIAAAAEASRVRRSGERTAEEQVKRVAGVVKRALDAHGPQSRKDLRAKRVTSQDRRHLDDALAYLVERGQAVQSGRLWASS